MAQANPTHLFLALARADAINGQFPIGDRHAALVFAVAQDLDAAEEIAVDHLSTRRLVGQLPYTRMMLASAVASGSFVRVALIREGPNDEPHA